MKRICCCLATVVLLVASLGWMTELMERKASVLKYQPFFEQKEDFDVLFFGTSHVINGIFPMELWKDYGIVSYNFGGHGNMLATSYWMMKNALDYTNPKVVVIDGLFLSADVKLNNDFSLIHLSMDAFPLSRTKLSAVWDLLDDPVSEESFEQKDQSGQQISAGSPFSLIWNFSVYHSRWNDLIEEDFLPCSRKEKGAESRIAVSEPGVIPFVSKREKFAKTSCGTEYLGRMIEECKRRDIGVLLTFLPFPAWMEMQMDANRLYDIAQEYDVPYINFLDKDVVNYETDCYDPNSHLNISGARKVTDYLGAYMTEHYDLADHRTDAAYDSWHGDYDAYQEMKISNLKQQQALNVYLMCLADKNFNVLIETKNPQIWKDERYRALFQNMGLDTARVTKRTDAVFIQEMGVQTEYLKDFCDWQRFGMDGGMGENEDLRITVFEKESMERADTAVFILQEDTFIRQTE